LNTWVVVFTSGTCTRVVRHSLQSNQKDSSGKMFLALTVSITLLLQLLQQGYYNIFDRNGVVNLFFF